jgi:NAD(P)H-nitrite reductase large subunit
MTNWLEANDSEFVCYCIEVDKKTIVDAIKNGNDTLSKIKESTKACTGSSRP